MSHGESIRFSLAIPYTMRYALFCHPACSLRQILSESGCQLENIRIFRNWTTENTHVCMYMYVYLLIVSSIEIHIHHIKSR